MNQSRREKLEAELAEINRQLELTATHGPHRAELEAEREKIEVKLASK